MLCATARSSEPVQFRTHVIEADIPGGYAVMVADMNKDGRPDILGMTSRVKELPWYENPTWDRHVLVQDVSGLVNMAAHDIDGDGIPEISIENEFSMVAAKSRGLVWLLQHQGDPREPWKSIFVDELTTSHHVAWADVDGDGTKELVNAPLIGADALAPKYEDNVPLVYYHVPKDLGGKWERLLIDDQLSGVLHRVRVVQWDDDGREELLTAGFDGITLHDPAGEGDSVSWKNTRLSRGHKEDRGRERRGGRQPRGQAIHHLGRAMARERGCRVHPGFLGGLAAPDHLRGAHRGTRGVRRRFQRRRARRYRRR